MYFSILYSSCFRFGEDAAAGPYHVKVEVESYKKDDPSVLLVEDLILEMGPTDELPYTIHRFLDEVDRNLYDGYKLYRSSSSSSSSSSQGIMDHVILLQQDHDDDVSVTTTEETNTIYYDPPLFHEEVSSDSSFLEASYLLCYDDVIAGRPGKSDFFIQMKHHDSDKDTDDQNLCFAKIIEDGFQTFLDLDDKGYHEVMRIRSISVLTSKKDG
jgi:hypothetical protein